MHPLKQKKPVHEMFTVALFTIAKRWKQPNCPLTDTWVNKVRCDHIMKYRSVTKRKEGLAHATMRMNLENIMLGERRQMQRVTYCVLLFTCSTNPYRLKVH